MHEHELVFTIITLILSERQLTRFSFSHRSIRCYNWVLRLGFDFGLWTESHYNRHTANVLSSVHDGNLFPFINLYCQVFTHPTESLNSWDSNDFHGHKCINPCTLACILHHNRYCNIICVQHNSFFTFINL